MTAILALLAKLAIGIWTDRGTLHYSVPRNAALGSRLRDILHGGFPSEDLQSLPRVCSDCIAPLAISPAAGLHIVCVHPAHGSVYPYKQFAAACVDTHRVSGLHAVRRLVDGIGPATFSGLVEHYAQQILHADLQRSPLVLFGWSSGGIIALRLATRLRELGCAIRLVVLGDTVNKLALSGPARRIVEDRFAWRGFIEAYLPDELQTVLDARNDFWTLDELERLARLVELARECSAAGHLLPPAIGALRHQLSVHREFLGIYERHEISRFEGRVLYIKASGSAASYSSEVRSKLGGELCIQEIEATHVSLLENPAVLKVVRAVESAAAL